MKWTRGHRSADVEDRRGGRRPSPKAAGMSGGALILGIIAYFVFGQDVLGVLGGKGGQSGSSTMSVGAANAGGGVAPENDADRELVEFISFALDDIQDTWKGIFPREIGRPYERAKLVIFDENVESACGFQTKATGPFYCPGDNQAYIDLSFYRELDRRFGAPGDFAQAYVLAHEVGHHVQNLLGDSARVHRARRQDPDNANSMSIRLELQADCYAGVWAHSTAKRDLLEAGDVEEGLAAAAAIGDDRLQKQATGRVTPESWTHGSSAQRVKWFRRGFDKGTVAACDTFSVDRP